MTHWSKAACATGLDAMLAAAGSVWIYTGSAPGSVDDPPTGQKLAACDLPPGGFGGAIVTFRGAIATAHGIASSMALGDGRAGYFRLVDRAGVALAQDALSLDEAIVRNERVHVVQCVVTMPES